ncbi:hypothetical protein [Pseudomonas turukhanskensis]|uniref:Uncharacterized protein n=1 Tax=Pseudomonas turukhanskensis TaxID=1806536 RepID=A0A9W6K4I7_9PSED|nr:hypothetical protein [Pseudomonas turukhanskensis]GLK87839.1 hypothetical protein GCM10017655_09010 [Pseudomonas turukhanskensis]
MLDDIELHDGVIKKLFVEYAKKEVTVSIEFYNQDGDRVAAQIIFVGVKSMQHVGSFDALSEHAGAGNINYWRPKEGDDSFIYLSDGCIVINAQNILFLPSPATP